MRVPELLTTCLLLSAATARADWETGVVPEGSNAYTIERHAVRLNIIGKSAVGLTDRLELSSYLPLIIFPNLGLKYRLIDTPNFALALEGDLGAGAFPVAGAFILPLPGAIFGGAAAGLLLGSAQMAELHLSIRPMPNFTVSARGAVFALEGGFVGAGVGAGVGGGGAGVAPAAFAAGTSVGGSSGGAELDLALGVHDALMAQVDFTTIDQGQSVFFMGSVSWIHAWDHVHLQVGLYNMVSLPAAEPPKVPVSPFVNVYWTLNRTPR